MNINIFKMNFIGSKILSHNQLILKLCDEIF